MLARGQPGLADPLGPARHRQDHHRAPARRAREPAFRAALGRVLRASPTSSAASRRRRSGASTGEGTLLFVDEIHRFNRAQQDGFLPVVETGTVVLVGATTENPSFALNGALLSRCQVLVLRRLDDAALEQLLQRAESAIGRPLPLTPEARAGAARHGRRRRALPAQHGRAARRAARRHRAARSGRARPTCWRNAPRSTTRTARSTTTSFRPCTNRCAAPIPTRRSTGARACSPAARTRATSPAACVRFAVRGYRHGRPAGARAGAGRLGDV